ncbi:MAG: exported protein of unknown function [Promethearchaeota archaeon]|nr:MAG: exported protein of unknown function [Candidatus Lokiarchaeota archaeon]
MKIKRRIRKLLSLIVLSVIILSFITTSLFLINSFSTNKTSTMFKNPNNQLKSQASYEIFYSKEWLEDNSFNPPASAWNNLSDGDTSDVNASLLGGEGRFEVLGEQHTFNESWDLTNPQNQTDWELDTQPKWAYYDPNIDPNNIYPDLKEKNSSGLCASHYWEEGADQIAVVNWNHTVNMNDYGVDSMLDYNITSASLTASFYAKVQATVSEDEGGSNEFTGAIDVLTDEFIDSGVNDSNGQPFQGQTGDFARFFVLISDTEYINHEEVAYFQSSTLGQDIPEIDEISNGMMITDSEEDLISYINNALQNNYINFTISVGIYIKCEDNFAQDADNWTLLSITGLNLTFTYKKIIDKGTTLSWQQTGDQINSSQYSIINATLGFEYKVDQDWLNATNSLNSELRIIINGSQYSETLELRNAPTSFQDAKTGGFDITNLINYDVNISLSIQLYLADEFDLEQKVTVSIDNVSLLIWYKEEKQEQTTDYSLFMNGNDRTFSRYYEVGINELVNVSFNYKNSTGGFIQNASVILQGYGAPQNLDEDAQKELYNITIDTALLEFGESYFSISASKFTYETIDIDITINVVKRNSSLENVELNQIPTTSISLDWNDELNITLSYNDTLENSFIANATVELIGTGISEVFSETGNQYNLTIILNNIAIGPNFLTISASKENYSIATQAITITVNEKDTQMEVRLNGTTTTSKTYNYLDIINFTAIYEDSDSNFISNATIQLRNGTSILDNFSELSSPDRYELLFATTGLVAGANTLSIYAKKDNYSISVKNIFIYVEEIGTKLKLFLNENEKEANEVERITVSQSINITIQYTDKSDNHLTNATVYISGAGFTQDNLTEYPLQERYTKILNGADFNQTINFLTVYAKIDNYTAQIISFVVEIIEGNSFCELLLDGVNKTDDPTLEITINTILNISVIYTNQSGLHIQNSNITLIGEGLSLDIPYNNSKGFNILLINTSEQLSIGVNLFTIVAEGTNYQTQTIDLRLILRRINIQINPIIHNETISTTPFHSFEISVVLNNTDFGGLLRNATVTFSWAFGVGFLNDTDDDGIFTTTLTGVPQGTYTIRISGDGGDNYDIESFNIIVSVIIPEETFLITYLTLIANYLTAQEETASFRRGLIISIVAGVSVGAGLTSYLLIYRLYLRYPPEIRRLRKFRKSLKRKNIPDVKVTSRKEGFRSTLNQLLGREFQTKVFKKFK